MTRKVVSVLEDASLLETAVQMRDHDISGMPVLNEQGAVTAGQGAVPPVIKLPLTIPLFKVYDRKWPLAF